MFAGVFAAWAMLLSMGPRLHVGGHLTPVRLPFDVLAHLPVLNSEVPSRFVEFFWLFAAVILAAGLREVCEVARRAFGPGRLRHWPAVTTTAIAGLALFPLVPNWPYASQPYKVPAWFTHEAKALPLGTPVLVYPLANSSNASSMEWQAAADMHFKMVGGYAIFSGPDRHATFASQYSPLQMDLALCSMGDPVASSPADVRETLRRWGIRYVAVSPPAAGARCARQLFEAALGPARSSGGMWVWG
jgi:hypothetical protein